MLEIIQNAFLTGNDRSRDWMKVTFPSEDEIAEVSNITKIEKDFLLRRLSPKSVRPVVQEQGFLAFHFWVPIHDGNDNEVRLAPLSIFLVPGYFVTLATTKLEFIDDIILPEAVRRWELILRISKKISLRYVHLARDLAKKAEAVEAELKTAQRHHVIYQALGINDHLLQLDMGLLKLEYVTDEIRSIMPVDSHTFMEEYEDARIEVRQAREQVDLEQETLNEIIDAYTYVIHNNVNHIFKFMAAFIIMVSIPIIVCDSMSMNVPLWGFRSDPWGFTIDVAVLLVLEVIMGWLFYRKGWLTLE